MSNLSEKYKILFIGDIVGRPGRKIVEHFLSTDNNRQKYDFVIANVENASHGFGLTKKNHDELISSGINAMTSGNHIWDKKDIYSFIDESECLIRPYNYHKSAQGKGYRIFNDKIIVINLLGRTFMPPIDCPFSAFENIVNELKEKNIFENKIIVVDFHAEASAEKQCFARFASELGAAAVLGTHTHVQTADEQIINNKCAYITDAGFAGSKNSIIGMKYDSSLKRLITSINERFDIEDASPYILNACEIDFSNNIATSIRRISFVYNTNEDGESED
ncbi:MAG: YmdB family metallophosphoesterase [Candidatus Gastranaerophilales bacterium]|nr:YmdB family metallophosphoesterase [Candidatus Gastranaerophilales bacterium]